MSQTFVISDSLGPSLLAGAIKNELEKIDFAEMFLKKNPGVRLLKNFAGRVTVFDDPQDGANFVDVFVDWSAEVDGPTEHSTQEADEKDYEHWVASFTLSKKDILSHGLGFLPKMVQEKVQGMIADMKREPGGDINRLLNLGSVE